MRRIGLVIGCALAGCGGETSLQDDLVRLSGPSPFAVGCAGAPQGSEVDHEGMEVAPFVAGDPGDPSHLVGVWEQDLWSGGGASGVAASASFDGGATWRTAFPRFSRCAGGDYARADHPWVTVARDGTAYAVARVFQTPYPSGTAILASRSTDGGTTWDSPAALGSDGGPDFANAQPSITAEPSGHRVYAVWSRLHLASQARSDGGAIVLARATDGVWEPARAIQTFAPGPPRGNVIGILPDGTLVDVFQLESAGLDSLQPIEIIRSGDGGDTWSDPILVGQQVVTPVADSDGHQVVSGRLPRIAVDSSTGGLYVVWENSSMMDVVSQAVALSSSLDGGRTWSQPRNVSHGGTHDAFAPGLVAFAGVLTVTYYDTRAADAAASGTFFINAWIARSRDELVTWDERPLTDPFDLRPAMVEGTYDLGDGQGLASAGSSSGVVSIVTAGGLGDGDTTDVYALPPYAK